MLVVELVVDEVDEEVVEVVDDVELNSDQN